MGAQLRLKLERPRAYRPEDFVPSDANADALEAIARWPKWHGGALALVGPAGSGKTHLARIWAERTGALTLAAGDEGPVFDAAAGATPVLVDDADRLEDDEALFHLINVAARSGGGLLLTARSLPATWITALPDLKSRLNALSVAEIAPPDDAVLTGVLRNLFRERNIRASDELLAYLVRRIDRSVPEAQRTVARLDEAADLEGRPVTRSLAKQVLDLDAADEDAVCDG